MTYDVVWGPSAESMLADIWMASASRSSITLAAAALDDALARFPLTFGESRLSSVHRVGFVPPLGIEYEVIEDDRRVIVLGVFAINRH